MSNAVASDLHANAMRSAVAANHDLQIAAASLGVPAAKLARCIIKQVGWAKFLAAVTSGAGIFTALGTAVNWDGVFECLMASLDEFK